LLGLSPRAWTETPILPLTKKLLYNGVLFAGEEADIREQAFSPLLAKVIYTLTSSTYYLGAAESRKKSAESEKIVGR